MVPKWCFGVDSHKHTQTHVSTHTHTHRFPLFSPHSLFIIMLTLRVSLGRRQRDSLLFHKGRLISAKSVCASLLIPHHSRIVWLPGIRKSLISGIYWKCGKSVSEALPLGDSLPELRESLKGKLSKDGEGDRGRLYFVPSSRGLQSQSCSNIERKCLAKLGLVARLLCVTGGGLKTAVGYILEGSMCLSLNDQSSSISDALVSSSLPHRKKSCLDMF